MAKKGQTFLDKILEDFGEKVLDNHKKKIEAVSTGCVSLNTSIGVGGIPKGMITVIFGPEGSGKTTVALNTAKQVANDGKKVLYIDVENLLNTELLKAVLGGDTKVENITILTPDSAEDAFMMVESGLDSEEFELIVVDSIGAMASRAEKKVDFDKDTMGQLPKIVARFIKRNTYDIRTKNIPILILNQVRDNVGVFTRVKSYKMPGGHQLQHQAAVIVRLSKAEDLKRGEEKVGILTKFVIQKNKLAPPYRSFTIPIIFGQGIDFYSDLIDFAKLLGVLTQKGAFYYFEGTQIGQGKAAARETLIQDKNTLDKVVEMLYNIVNHNNNIADMLNDMEDEMEMEDAE